MLGINDACGISCKHKLSVDARWIDIIRLLTFEMAKLKFLMKRFDQSKVMSRSELRKQLNYSVPIRKIPQQNILYKLKHREINGGRPNSHLTNSKSFYSNVFPNFTVAGIEKPPCFLRKFSPNGKYFIAFSLDQTSLEIYEFQGSQAAEKLLDGVSGDYLPPNSDPLSTSTYHCLDRLTTALNKWNNCR